MRNQRVHYPCLQAAETPQEPNVSILEELTPSPLVRRFARQIIDGLSGKPLLDVACGSGRNAFALARLGCAVVCIDKDLTPIRTELLRLSKTSFSKTAAQLVLQRMDLVEDPWPFRESSVGGIVNIHCLLPSLFPCFESAISPDGYLLIETVPGCGGNYRHLPKAGELEAAFDKSFILEFYNERRVGPSDSDAVTVRLLGKRKNG